MKKTSYYTVITGASSGIGLALANEFARNGHNLILVARSEELLNEISNKISLEYKVSVQYIVADLTIMGEIESFKAEIIKKDYKINILINNAGFGLLGEFSELELGKQQNMIDLNIKALVELSYFFAQVFKKQGFGWIMNVSSIASFLAGPYMAVYYASKNFVTSFSLAIASEFKSCNIIVSTLCPGYTETKFQDVSGMGDNPLLKKVKSKISSQDVAKIGYYGMIEKSSLIIIPGIINQIIINCLKFIPISAKLWVINQLQNPK